MVAFFIRDSFTEVPAAAFRLSELGEEGVLRRGGFNAPADYVVLISLDGGLRASADPFDWPNATLRAAHLWLMEHLDEVTPGGEVNAEPIRLAMGGRR